MAKFSYSFSSFKDNCMNYGAFYTERNHLQKRNSTLSIICTWVSGINAICILNENREHLDAYRLKLDMKTGT